MRIKVFDDLESLSQAAWQVVHDRCAQTDRFAIGLSGGSTPGRLYELLAERPGIDWAKVFAFWVDERYVPSTDEHSNERLARRLLLDRVPIPREQIFPMVVPGGPVKAAMFYHELLLAFGEDRNALLDVAIMGVGGDGHTASLFPGDGAMNVQGVLACAGVSPGPVNDRVSLSRTALQRVGLQLYMVTGENKAGVVKRLLEPPGEDALPAQVVIHEAREAWLFLDSGAASQLS